jgi:hypothetical protein
MPINGRTCGCFSWRQTNASRQRRFDPVSFICHSSRPISTHGTRIRRYVCHPRPLDRNQEPSARAAEDIGAPAMKYWVPRITDMHVVYKERARKLPAGGRELDDEAESALTERMGWGRKLEPLQS